MRSSKPHAWASRIRPRISARLQSRAKRATRITHGQEVSALCPHSISGLLTSQIEQLAETEDDYERAMNRAFARMEKGFPMGEIPKLDRDALHER